MQRYDESGLFVPGWVLKACGTGDTRGFFHAVLLSVLLRGETEPGGEFVCPSYATISEQLGVERYIITTSMRKLRAGGLVKTRMGKLFNEDFGFDTRVQFIRIIRPGARVKK